MNRSPTRARWALLIAGVLCAHGAQAQLSSTNSRLFLRNTTDGLPFAILGRLDPSVPGFGEAMAVGDFNCDGIEDLAIGAPDANANNMVHSGQIVIAYGSPLGLRSNDGIGLSQSSPNMPGGSEVGDYFGWALAAGGLTDDSCDDLVAGTPGENHENVNPLLNQVDAGAVTFLRGRSTGMTGLGSFNLPFAAEFSTSAGLGNFDNFGQALAIGNVVSAPDSFSELIIGIPGHTDLSPINLGHGAINVRGAGSAGPLQRNFGRVFDNSCCGQAFDAGDRYGSALAIGNFDGDGLPDVAIGVPGQDVGDNNAGSVTVMYGGVGDAGAGGFLNFNQDSPGVPGNSRELARFGAVLAAGDFDADGDSDLVIGLSGFRLPEPEAGELIVRNGRSDGVNGFDGASLWSSAEVGLPNAAGDSFAKALAVGDFNGDGFDDLAAGAPGVNTSGVVDSGAVVVLYGTATGLELTGRQIWHKGSPGIPGELGVDEQFGAGLAAGDFNADGVDDLVVAIPRQILGTTPRGGVLVIYGRRPAPLPNALFANGFE